jgi:hypothetical protein
MSISSFFASLGAPLVNPRWSWGAQRPSDGAIFLRVFREEKWIADGRLHMTIGWDVDLMGDNQRLGYLERMRHVAAIRAGAPCFMVMCSAQDPSARSGSWRIAFFDEDEVRVGGKLVDRGGMTYIEVVGRKPAIDMKVR